MATGITVASKLLGTAQGGVPSPPSDQRTFVYLRDM